MAAAEYACVFVRPPRERLPAAERLVRALPAYLGGAAGECDLYHSAASGYLAAMLRAAPEAFTPRRRSPASPSGRRASAPAASPSPRSRPATADQLRAELRLCERVVRRDAPRPARRRGRRRFFAEIGGRGYRPPPPGPPVLGVDLDGPGGEGARYQPGPRTLFVAGDARAAARRLAHHLGAGPEASRPRWRASPPWSRCGAASRPARAGRPGSPCASRGPPRCTSCSPRASAARPHADDPGGAALPGEGAGEGDAGGDRPWRASPSRGLRSRRRAPGSSTRATRSSPPTGSRTSRTAAPSCGRPSRSPRASRSRSSSPCPTARGSRRRASSSS